LKGKSASSGRAPQNAKLLPARVESGVGSKQPAASTHTDTAVLRPPKSSVNAGIKSPPKPAEPIRRRKLYEEVVARLEAEIHGGKLLPGDLLPSERELMQHFGVGRPAIREALFALHRMGLVIVANGERPRISSPSPKTLLGELSGAARLILAKPTGMRNFQQARRLFESALAEEAARLASEEDIVELKNALAANAAAIGDDAQFVRTDVAFHLAIARTPRNPIYIALHEAIVEWLVDQRRVSLHSIGADRAAFQSHRRIFEAIRVHDAGAAKDAMCEHLIEIEKLYWKVKGTAK
jgi:GntR family transcriptional regulator, sialic acid-inducible nan operon repressor